MKRRDFIKLGLIAASAISMSYAARSEDAELIVGSNVGSPPFAFKDGDGYSGFDIEVWAEVAKGPQPQMARAADAVRRLDPGIADPEHRRDRLPVVHQAGTPEGDRLFRSLLPEGLVAVTGVSNTTIKTPDDLAGKAIGTETGTIAVDFIREHIKGASIEQMPTINNALLALSVGGGPIQEIDYVSRRRSYLRC